jgi:transposase
VSYNFRPVERDQQYLLPPSLRDWLPEDDLAWVVLDAVDQVDLGAIYARYRADGWGAPAFDPAMMTALLLYAYAIGLRSSRRIEAACRRDIAFRVISVNQVPDHATIARFRADHAEALGQLFTEILRLCAAAGMVEVGLVALDGTKIAAATSLDANRTADSLGAEIERMLIEAERVDAAEDAAAGADPDDAPPPALGRRSERLARFREARERLVSEETERRRAHEAMVADREAFRAETGHRAPGRDPRPFRPRPDREANPTDPDSRQMKVPKGWLQGYNAQALVASDGLVIAAGLTQQRGDVGQLEPLLRAATANLARAGVAREIGTLVADAGYWGEGNAALERADGPRFLIPPMTGLQRRPGSRRPLGPGRARMFQRLADPAQRALYRRRQAIVEPVFGQLKEIRGIRRFQRRGVEACAAEWQLACATHNLLKLWRHKGRSGSGGPQPDRRLIRKPHSVRSGAGHHCRWRD